MTKTLSILGPALLKTPPPPSGDIIKIKKKLTIKAGIANLIQVKKTSLRKKERKKEDWNRGQKKGSTYSSYGL